MFSAINHANRYNPKCNLLISGGILAISVEKGMDKLGFSHLLKSSL